MPKDLFQELRKYSQTHYDNVNILLDVLSNCYSYLVKNWRPVQRLNHLFPDTKANEWTLLSFVSPF